MTWLPVLIGILVLGALVWVVLSGQGRRGADRRGTGDEKQVPTVFPSIQGAINASETGDTIVIQPGIYHEDLVLEDRGITLTSADPQDPEVVAATVIQGSGYSSVVRISGENQMTALRGLTITGGGGTVKRQQSTLGPGCRAGGGVLVEESGGALLEGLVIKENQADLGGGLYIDVSAAVTVSDCRIQGNKAHLGGGVRAGDDFTSRVSLDPLTDRATLEVGPDTESSQITGCDISGNQAFIGAGISLSGRIEAQIDQNQIRDNRAGAEGGGISAWNEARIVIRDNQVEGNSVEGDYAFGGGISLARGAGPLLTGNLIRENRVSGNLDSGGGGLWSYQSRPTLKSNRFHKNTGQRRGGGLGASGHSEVILTGNRFAGNSAQAAGDIYSDDTSRLSGADLSKLRTQRADLGSR